MFYETNFGSDYRDRPCRIDLPWSRGQTLLRVLALDETRIRQALTKSAYGLGETIRRLAVEKSDYRPC